MNARNRELFGLIPASLLVTAGFAGVFIQRSNTLTNISLTYGAIFLGLCLAGHIGIRIPGVFIFQPTEFAKIGLVIFLASYLRDTRQVMVVGARRVLGVTIPPIKHFGPVLVIWGVAMVILLLLHDIGSSLMFYGALLSMLYVATGRLSFVVIGVLAFALGAWYLGGHIQHINDRVDAWLHPFNPHLYNKIGGSYQ